MTLDIEYLCSYYGEYGAPRVLVTTEDALTDTVTIETLLVEENA